MTEAVLMETPEAGRLAMIRSRIDMLSKAERQVARRLLDEPALVIHLSITELAESAGVGEATVSRFCRRMGFRGFQDLKIGIASELAPDSLVREPDSAPYRTASQQDPFRVAARRCVDTIDSTTELLSPDSVRRAVDLLSSARRIDVYGQGGSALTALDAQHYFVRLGKTANAPVDSHAQAMSAALLGPGDVSLAFSHSGSAKDVVSSQQLARHNGAATICVTGAARSPIVAASSIVLLTATEDTLVSNLRTKMMQLFVLELLVEGCARQLGASAQRALDLTTAAVVEKMY